MYVNETIIEYKAYTTADEDKIIDECLAILENITDTMEECNCDMLDCGYPELPERISIEDIKIVKSILFNLKDVHTMF